jgi:hypothetical protein
MDPDLDGPSPAERARTLLHAADSLTLDWAGGRHEVHREHHCDGSGALTVDLPLSSPLAHQLGETGRGAPGRVPVRLHLTDVAPMAGGDRVRAQLTVTGRVWPGPVGRTCPAHREAPGPVMVAAVEVADITFRRGGATVVVAVQDYRRAEPDPLALLEAGQLAHLARDHPDAVDLLTRLLDARKLMGARGVVPWALDRYGIVLRILRPDGVADVRLRFQPRVATAGQAGSQLRRLLVEATARRSWPSPGAHGLT